jgi:peroxiredoxin
VEGEPEAVHVLAVGEDFPTCRVAVLNGDEDREYLELPEGAKFLQLSELKADFVLIQLYNTLCADCVAETKKLTRFFQQVEEDPELAGRLKIIGIGVYDSNLSVVRFRKHYDVAYPLFLDKSGHIFECLGQTELPLAYLVRSRGDGSWRIELIKRGYFEPDERFLNVLRAAVNRRNGS